MPNRLYPPHTVFLRQSGQSYEIATALCSLLVGLNYDAYVVSGYALRDVTLKIMTRTESPFPIEQEEEVVVEEEVVDPKYVLKPPRDLRSKFLLYMAQREVDRANAEQQRIKDEERKLIEEKEKPPFDDLHGLRVHAWVLIRSGRQEIETSFFIEPSTGCDYPSDTTIYCGIESVWNHENYWVNLQDCSNGIAHMDYDFRNVQNWEHLLAGEPIQTREMKGVTELDDDEVQLKTTFQEKHLDMPIPWSLPISIPHHVIHKRYPNGIRQTWYKYTFVEEFAPYIQPDGLVTRICRYRDFDCSPDQIYVVEERYENRHDHLNKIITEVETGFITEYFSRGREDAAKVIHKRYPNGIRQTWYKYTFVEEFAPYIQPDGLVTRICRYRDFDCSPDQIYVVEERYENRHDHLNKIITEVETGFITEYFMLVHSYYLNNNKLEAERTIEFYADCRFDCMSKLELNTECMREYYVNREDFFSFRDVVYAKRGHPPPGILEGPRRIILVLFEKFNRNPAKTACEDIASRKFAVVTKDIHLKYHYDTGKVTASTRYFLKPSMAEIGDRITFNPDMTSGYQSEVGAKPPRQLNLFNLLELLMKEEEESMKQVRAIEDMVADFVRVRDLERAIPKLDVSIFHREQNVEYRQGMLEREQQQKEHREREVEEDTDFLAPHLAKLGNPLILTSSQALAARDECLNDFKMLLVNRANDIQHQFDKCTLEIQEKHDWYTKVLDTLTLLEEEQYFREASQKNFLLHIFEMRLARHRDLSPYRFRAMEEYLRYHPTLAVLSRH